ncbi:hypothetical protein GGS20DRAFT_584422 [Poronia punctata]|nr:hypothetical protein GGS20DRAFT_584422 [Poronia punctata]
MCDVPSRATNTQLRRCCHYYATDRIIEDIDTTENHNNAELCKKNKRTINNFSEYGRKRLRTSQSINDNTAGDDHQLEEHELLQQGWKNKTSSDGLDNNIFKLKVIGTLSLDVDMALSPYEPNNDERDTFFHGFSGSPRLVARTGNNRWSKSLFEAQIGWTAKLTQHRKFYVALDDPKGLDIVGNWTQELSADIIKALSPCQIQTTELFSASGATVLSPKPIAKRIGRKALPKTNSGAAVFDGLDQVVGLVTASNGVPDDDRESWRGVPDNGSSSQRRLRRFEDRNIAPQDAEEATAAAKLPKGTGVTFAAPI